MDRDDLILAYVQGKLTDAQTSTFEQSMQQDPNMAAEVSALREARAEFAREDAQIDPSAGWKRLEAAIDEKGTGAANDNRPVRLSLWQAGGLIAASLVLWQVAAVPLLHTGPEPGYEAVSEATTGAVLQVMFSNAASLGDVTVLLRDIDGTVVDGPGALGLYRISFANSLQLEAARAVLEARIDLVEMITVQ